MNRREFIKASLVGLITPLIVGLPLERFLPKAYAEGRVILAQAQGGGMEARLKRVLTPLGGIERFVHKGSRVVLKPNAGWARKPEEGANTNPELIYHLTKLCFKAGARSVEIYEHSCDSYELAFKESGIQAAVESAGGKMYSAHNRRLYRSIPIPRGKALKNCQVIKPVLEADCLINVPVTKSHNALPVTLGIKNLMGLVLDRGFWHYAGLEQCMVDFATRVIPQLTVIDATQLLLTNGPKGPGKLQRKDMLIAGIDPVACDALACTLFNLKPESLPYLGMAKQMGLGECDLNKIEVKKV